MYGEQSRDRGVDRAEPDVAPADEESSDLWAESLEAWVCGLNVQRFRALLDDATDPHQRAILTRLIDEHEASFRRFATFGGPDARSGSGGT